MHNSRWLHSCFRLNVATVFLIACLVSFDASAQGGASLVPLGTAGNGAYGAGLNAATDYRHMPSGAPGANDPVYRRPYGIPRSSLGAHARAVAKGGLANAAMIGALAGLGWWLDGVLNDIYKPGSPYVPNNNPYVQQKIGVNVAPDQYTEADGYWVANTRAEVCPMISNRNGGTTWNPTTGRCTGPAGNYIPVQLPLHLATPRTLPQPTPGVVPDSDLGQAIMDNPATWQGVLNNPDGYPYRTGELVAEQNALASELNQAYGTNIASQTIPATGATAAISNTPLPQTNPQTNPNGTTNPSTQAEPMKVEFPVFCTWAAKICELADWMREGPDEDPDLDVPEVQLPVTAPAFTASFSGGCPPPETVNVMGAQLEFSYVGMCTVAGYLRPVLIAISLFMAAYIISGKKRA